jgi:hypothetical protein
MAMPAESAAFWAKVDMLGDCWVWTHARTSAGYGNVRANRRNYTSHRCVYEYVYGPVPARLLIRHSCDNPPCVNPLHLLVGTAKMNTADMWDRGRGVVPTSVGSANGRAILTADLVVEIRERFAVEQVAPKRLASAYGVDGSVINRILTGRSWTSAGGPICTTDRRGRHGNHVRGTSHPKSKEKVS